MAKMHRIQLGGQQFHARSGQLLLDAALLNGIELPHDCRAGRCGSCLTKVRAGITLGGETRQAGIVHACQARVFGELKLEVEALPPVTQVNARIVHLIEVAPDIVEVTMKPAQVIEMLPGQYCRFRFRGFGARAFSPTAALDSLRDDGLLRLNIKRVRDGRVTPQIGKAIKVGHQLTIEGPFGHAFLRQGGHGRLVLVGSGTGFAPVWAVAAAALRENPLRRIVLLAASRKLSTLYMAQALDLASRYANVKVAACVDELKQKRGLLLAGDTIDHLPTIANDDIVYAAGSPKLVDAVGDAAHASGAQFYADPFEPEVRPNTSGWLDNAKAWLRTG